jgi:hypothetical protein
VPPRVIGRSRSAVRFRLAILAAAREHHTFPHMPKPTRKTLSAWAREFGIDPETLRSRAARNGALTKVKRVRGLVLLTRRQAERCAKAGKYERTMPPVKPGGPVDWLVLGGSRAGWEGGAAQRAPMASLDWIPIRRKTGPRRPPGDMPPRYDWSRVDWRKQDIEIAEQLGCSDTTVSITRRRLGKPKAALHHKKRGIMKANAVIDAILRACDPHTSNRTITKRVAKQGIFVDEHHVGKRRRALGIPPARPRPSIWSELVDWRLVNQDIRAIWKVHTVGAFREYHAGKVKPMFTYNTGKKKGEFERFQGRMRDPRYLAIYRAQVKLAARKDRTPNTYRRY